MMAMTKPTRTKRAMLTPSPMLPASAMYVSHVDAVLRCAIALLPVREAAANNTGRFVEAIQRYGGGHIGEPWCAYFVYYCGYKMLGESWPLARTGSCDMLMADASRRSFVVPTPVAGGLFFIMKTKNDATHVGFVRTVEADGKTFTTVEGNSNDKGHRDGDGVVSNVRGLTGSTRYVFVDWSKAP